MLDDINDERLAPYVSLTERQLRNKLEPAMGILIAESEKVIRVALSAGIEPHSLLMEEKWLGPMGDLVASLPDDVPVYVLPHDEIATLTGYNVTRGALCCMRRPRPRDLDEVLDGARRVAVIEDVVDTTNVGAIFRSAAALGVDAVLLSPRCADPLCRRSLRVSMGTVMLVPWTRIGPWPEGGLEKLRERGFTTLALALSDDSVPLGSPELAGLDRIAMVFGTEGDGLTSEAVSGCDLTVRIPMAHGVDSLNVAAASAVTFWELCRDQSC
ncbi:MAG: RNA methyltransferase [Atopobiaceae bacterium]|jgi:tRNA G18 (ribose-2'-O)-methylase SpoU|nr:RNA methyltransferase [Atopobiaceae bacterium]